MNGRKIKYLDECGVLVREEIYLSDGSVIEHGITRQQFLGEEHCETPEAKSHENSLKGESC